MISYFAQIVSKPDCPYCDLAKEFMLGMDIQYTEMVVGEDCLWEDITAQLPEVKTVPQIWINGDHVGGYDDLVKWAETA
jgi:glutaredoxin